MKIYKITIFRQSRVIISLFLFPVFLFAALFLGAEMNSFIIPVLFLTFCLSLMYYFTVGNLIVRIKDDNELFFDWNKKMIFNYKFILPVKIEDIKSVVLDEGQLLRKIKTHDRIIYINNSKIKNKDGERFIGDLKRMIEKYNVEVLDSWDEFAEKGYIRKAYILNSAVLILSITGVTVFTILKGFHTSFLSVLLLFIPQMILYGKQMRDKIDGRK